MQSNLLCAFVIMLAIMAGTNAFEFTVKDINNVEFSQSAIEVVQGLIDITLKGKIDHENIANNKLGAFVEIAGKAFPILESFGLNEDKLEFTEKYCWDQGFVSGCTSFTFEFYIGWYVTNGTAKDYQYLNVTYVPYIRGEGSVSANAAAWMLQLSANGNSRFVNIETPISNQINFNSTVQYCYGAITKIIDPSFLFTVQTAVKSCEADMAQNIIYNPGTFQYACAFGSPIVIPVVNYTDTPVTYYSLVARTCITLYTP